MDSPFLFVNDIIPRIRTAPGSDAAGISTAKQRTFPGGTAVMLPPGPAKSRKGGGRVSDVTTPYPTRHAVALVVPQNEGLG